MAIAMGTTASIGSCTSAPSSSSLGKGRALKGKGKGKGRGGERSRTVIFSAAAGGLTDQYRTLRIQPGASEKEIKQAFRQLALQYHPDVCKGNNCGVHFHQINQAYDIVMSSLGSASEEEHQWQSEEWGGRDDDDDQMRGMCDSSWDMWEEWMGWEGAGIRDYSSHINPYI